MTSLANVFSERFRDGSFSFGVIIYFLCKSSSYFLFRNDNLSNFIYEW